MFVILVIRGKTHLPSKEGEVHTLTTFLIIISSSVTPLNQVKIKYIYIFFRWMFALKLSGPDNNSVSSC